MGGISLLGGNEVNFNKGCNYTEINIFDGFYTMGGKDLELNIYWYFIEKVVIGMEIDSDQSLNITTYASSYAILKHLLLPLLSMIIKILRRCFLKDFKLIYIEGKIKYELLAL